MSFDLENIVIYAGFDFFNDHDDDEYIISKYIYIAYDIGDTIYTM